MRVALLGGGTIARLILERQPPGIQVVAVLGRATTSRGAALAREFRIPYVTDRQNLLAARPEAVIEAASHEAVREHLVPLLESGVSVVVLSCGALADDGLKTRADYRFLPGMSLGWQWDFVGPIRIGDTVHVRITINKMRESKSRPDRAIIWEGGQVINQRGEVVQAGEHSLMIWRRPQ